MKYIITITILITIALSINIYFTDKAQEKAIVNWEACFKKQGYSQWDNYVEPNVGKEIKKTNDWCAYVFEMCKVYK